MLGFSAISEFAISEVRFPVTISIVAASIDWIAVEPDAGTFVDVSPVVMQHDTVAPATSLAITLAAASIEWSDITPAQGTFVVLSPVSVDYGVIAPTTIIAINSQIAAIEWSAVAPVAGTFTALSPLIVEYVTIAPATSLAIALAVASIEWSDITPEQGTFTALSPLIVDCTVVAPAISIAINIQTESIEWITVSPDAGTFVDTTFVTFEYNTVVPATSLTASVAIASVEYSVVALTTAIEVTLSPFNAQPEIPTTGIIVDPDNGPGTDYVSLNLAEAGERQLNSPTPVIFLCRSSGGTADTSTFTAFLDADWGTTPVEIWQAATDRHGGVLNLVKYRKTSPIIACKNFTIDGIQFINTAALSVNQNVSYDLVVRNIIVNRNSVNSEIISLASTAAAGSRASISSSILIDGQVSIGIGSNDWTVDIVNNSLINPDVVAIHITGSTAVVMQNTIAYSAGSAVSQIDGGGSFHASSGFNATDAASGLPGSNNRHSQTFDFEDEAGDDYRITINDGGAKGFGTSSPAFDYEYDIAGQVWGSSRSIGAYEPEPSKSSIMQWSPVAPLAEITAGTTTSPVVIEHSVIPPDTGLSIASMPASIEWSPVVPGTISLLVPVAVSVDWNLVAIEPSLAIALGTVSVDWSSITPEAAIVEQAAAAVLEWIPQSVASSISSAITALPVEWSIQDRQTTIAISLGIVSIEWSPLAPTGAQSAHAFPVVVDWITTTQQISLVAATAPLTVEWSIEQPSTSFTIAPEFVAIEWTIITVGALETGVQPMAGFFPSERMQIIEATSRSQVFRTSERTQHIEATERNQLFEPPEQPTII